MGGVSAYKRHRRCYGCDDTHKCGQCLRCTTASDKKRGVVGRPKIVVSYCEAIGKIVISADDPACGLFVPKEGG